MGVTPGRGVWLALATSMASLACREQPSLEDIPPAIEEPAPTPEVGAQPGKPLDFLEPAPIGRPLGATTPWITHLVIVDLDRDGELDVVFCDAKLNQIAWIRRMPDGSYREEAVGSLVIAPAHVTPADVDSDGDLDLLVAEMGQIFPTNDKIGSVIVLENDGQQEFTNRVLLENVARVTDVEPGDFDGDGDVDLAVAQFGYDEGEIRWMENRGDWTFESHPLLSLSGTIHTPVGDMDGDGDPDITAVVAQEWEEIYVFENLEAGRFETHRVYGSTNSDFGSSGISLVDLDRDGDLDVLYTNGDAFDYNPPEPRPWHGIQWLENRGNLEFAYHRIGDVPGAYSATAADADNDGDLDIVVVSLFNYWDRPDAASMVWFENDGSMGFTVRELATTPTHLLALDRADMDGDGWVDFVTGGMHAFPPFDRMSRILLWRNHWPTRSTKR